MQVEAPILTKEKVAALSVRLPVSGSNARDLNRWTIAKRGAEEAISRIVASFSEQVEGFAAVTPNAQSEVGRSTEAFERTKARVSGDASSINAVIEGIRRDILAHPDFRPPLVLTPLKCFAIRDPHPLIVKSEKELELAKDNLKKVSVEAQRKTDVLAATIYPWIDEGYEDLQRADNNILALHRRVAVAGSDLDMRAFVETVPWQAEQLVTMFAYAKADDPEILAEAYQDFVEFMHNRFKYPNQIAEHRMSPEAYRKIKDTRVTNSWKAYIGYRKLMQWAQDGIIPQPAVPAVIDTVGERIRSFVPEIPQEAS